MTAQRTQYQALVDPIPPAETTSAPAPDLVPQLDDPPVLLRGRWRGRRPFLAAGQEPSLIETPPAVGWAASPTWPTLPRRLTRTGSLDRPLEPSLNVEPQDLGFLMECYADALAGWRMPIPGLASGTLGASIKASAVQTFLRQFDFGPVGSIAEAGYTPISEFDNYTPAIGYGWVHENRVQTRDRASPASLLLRDIAVSEFMTFRVDVPIGSYTVRLITGDSAAFHDDQFVWINDVMVGELNTAINEYIAVEYNVSVTQGFIEIRMHDGHDLIGIGEDFYVCLCGIQIFPLGAGVPAPPLPEPPPPPPPGPEPPTSITTKLVFGPPQTPVPEGYTLIPYTTTYGEGSPARTFGYENGAVVRDFDRETGLDETRYFAQSFDLGFRIDVPPGVYEVSVTCGDATSPHDQEVYLQYHRVDVMHTQTNVPLTRVYQVECPDGVLRVQMFGYGPQSGDQTATLHFLTYTLLPQPLSDVPPGRLLFSFGEHPTIPSPLADGYTRILKDDLYTIGSHGWLPGAVGLDDRDQGANSDYFLTNPLTRCLAVMTDASFRMTLPNGDYELRLICGDIGSPHDFRIYVQGQLVDTISVVLEDYRFLTYGARVTNGTLTLRIEETESPNNYGLLNALEVYPYVPVDHWIGSADRRILRRPPRQPGLWAGEDALDRSRVPPVESWFATPPGPLPPSPQRATRESPKGAEVITEPLGLS